MTGIIHVYTDGACYMDSALARHPGGWASVILKDGKVDHILYGKSLDTTSNRMELTAAISAILGAAKLREEDEAIILFSDSKYVVNPFLLHWVETWESKGKSRGMLIKRDGGNVENADLWWVLIYLARYYNVEFKWVKAHTGNEFNELADNYAKKMMYEAVGGKKEPSQFKAARERPMRERFKSHKEKKNGKSNRGDARVNARVAAPNTRRVPRSTRRKRH